MDKCDLVFRETECNGKHHWVPVEPETNGKAKCVYACEYHAAIFAMLMELHHLYTTDRIANMTTEEIIDAWVTAFGTRKAKRIVKKKGVDYATKKGKKSKNYKR